MAALYTPKNSPESAEPSLAPRSATSMRLRVLVVEDHADTRFLLKMLLELRGVEVWEAGDGEAALFMAEQSRPHLILMDGTLPLLDGFTATHRLRLIDGLCDVPVIFLSGHGGPEHRARAADVGCDDFLVKPFDIKQLDHVLERHLFQRSKPKACSDSA